VATAAPASVSTADPSASRAAAANTPAAAAPATAPVDDMVPALVATAAPAKNNAAKPNGKAAVAAAGAGPGGSVSGLDSATPGGSPPPPELTPWDKHSLEVLNRRVRGVAELRQFLANAMQR